MNKVDSGLKEKMFLTKNEIKEFLQPVENISEDDAHTIIKRYVASIEGNFLSWMAGASISSRSVISRFAADENLWVELRDDHPSMLRKFAKCCNAEPDRSDFQYVHNEVMKIRSLVGELSGIKNITLMAVLENTSAAFVPYLSELAKKIGCDDLTYTDVHGEADIDHANQFLEALTDEQNLGYKNSSDDIDQTIRIVIDFMKKIFVL
ncbi:MAG: iron-containing redox enzyme family protein [Candidatus Aenigmarchaeota archaeon]|nr:iron-containing redox enzyme family protein [Candidatus Aenigmarchaeota archaeon]